MKKSNSVDIKIYANFLRQFFLYFFFIINIFLFIMFFKIGKIKIQYSLLFIFLYFLLQIPGLFYTENSIKNISYIISSVSLLLLIILISHYFKDEEKLIFLSINFFFLALIFLMVFLPSIVSFLKGYTNLYGSLFENNDLFLNKTSPRSSGTSRSALILSLYFMLFLVFFNLLKKQKLLINILIIFLFTTVFLYQSRINIFLLLIIVFYYHIYQNKINKTGILKTVFTFIFIPLLLSLIFSGIYGFNASKKYSQENILKKPIDVVVNSIDRPIREFTTKNLSSGRVNDWNNLLINMKKNNILGYGSQADRFLINQSASNGLLYAFSSSGILGILVYFLFSIIIFIKIIKNILLKNHYKLNPIIFFNSIIILIIFVRSLVESSYAVFGIDQIILFSSLIFINKKPKKHGI